MYVTTYRYVCTYLRTYVRMYVRMCKTQAMGCPWLREGVRFLLVPLYLCGYLQTSAHNPQHNAATDVLAGQAKIKAHST